ncbi:MAG: HEAT repeat domain-containing protein [Myxococcota bacterium]
MRKLVAASLLALAVIAAPACKEPDPNKFETHIERIKDADKRPQGFSGLETLVKTVASAQENEDLLQEFADKVVPVFEEVWDEAKEQRPKMLQLCLDIGHPGCAPIWNRAIVLDGSSEAREATLLALEGVRKAKADGSLETIIEQFGKLVDDPKNDGGDRAGEVRGLMVDTLGELGSPKAVPVLIKSLEQTVDKQPVGVHRKVATAMGRIGDVSAIDALLTAVYRVPDAPTTTNIAEKVKIAIGSIGEAAIPRVIAMLKAEHEEVQKLAAANSVDQVNIQLYAASLLGVIGSGQGVDELVAAMPVAECAPDYEPPKPAEGEEEAPVIDTAKIRAQLGNSLGFIGDPKGAEAVCACATWSKNPGDMFALAEALGRIGGADAAKCLENVIRTGVYDQDAVENSSFIHEIQWEASRFGVLAADADTVGSIKAAIEASAAADPKVKENTAAWATGIQTIEKCGKDKGCYEKVLDDSNADWFAREVAAVNVARMSSGDAKAALSLAKAYKVRNPDARVTMAWLTAHVMQGKPCQECVDEIERIMKDEKDSRLPAKYQLSVLTARYSIGKLRAKGGK